MVKIPEEIALIERVEHQIRHDTSNAMQALLDKVVALEARIEELEGNCSLHGIG